MKELWTNLNETQRKAIRHWAEAGGWYLLAAICLWFTNYLDSSTLFGATITGAAAMVGQPLFVWIREKAKEKSTELFQEQ